MNRNPYDHKVEPYKPEPHPFYEGRKAQDICKNCSELILKDRWVGGTGWTHYTTASSLCYDVTYAEPG